MSSIALYIVMPIFNAAATLPRAVGSLQCIAPRNRGHICLLGVDDGSTDDSADIFARSASAVEGLQWRLLQRENGGSGAARNDALRTFDRGWTLLLDADDELVADPLPYLDQNSDQVTALLFAADYVREGRRLFRLSPRKPDARQLRRMFSKRSPYCTLSVVFRRERLVSLFADDLRYLEDWYFFAGNPDLFAHCRVLADRAIGRVHTHRRSKSASQEKNGYYRIAVAERLADLWQADLSPVVANNLAIQGAIGRLQMGEKVAWREMIRLPASVSLWLKLLVYRFAYRLYLRFYPYA